MLQTMRRPDQMMLCTAVHVLEGVELRCGLIHHAGGMHCDLSRALWWMAVG